MVLLIILFSFLLGVGMIIVWLRRKPKYVISFLETSTPDLLSFRLSEKTRKRYFPHPSGIVDLSKHPEFLRFRENLGNHEYLVEPWDRKSNLYVEEGKSKVVVFSFIQDGEGGVLAIPCLRTVESIITTENNDPLLGYSETKLGVSWDKGREIIDLDNLIGIVRYESVQS